MVLRPLEFSDCLHDSPFFRENLQAHEKELENTSEAIKGLLKECRRLLAAMKELSKAQRSFAATLNDFTFEFIGSDQQTEKETVICGAFHEFAQIIETMEDHRDLLMESAQARLLSPLERFRKEKIQGTKEAKKAFDKQSERYLSLLERHLALSPKKKETSLAESDAVMEQEQKQFRKAAMEYVKVLLDVQERKKFEFVEPLLGFMTDQMTFYHSAYETGQEYKDFMNDLQVKLQDVRQVWQDSQAYTESLMKSTEERGLTGDTRNGQFARQGYLYSQKERKLGGITSGLTSSKCFCQYMQSNALFVIFPITDHSKGKFTNPESLVIDKCVRRMTDSIEKRFCFDVTAGERTLVLQALSNDDRRLWLEALGGKEPIYMETRKLMIDNTQAELSPIAYQFISKCIETIERRGINDEGLYRVAGVTSKVQKLTTFYEKNKLDKVSWNDVELEVKTITSAIKYHFRHMQEPLFSYALHQEFLDAAKHDRATTIMVLQQLVKKLPPARHKMLKLLMQHLHNVATHADKNRMLPSNLGVVFGPTLMRPREDTVASIMDIKYQNEVTEIMVKEYTKIFTSSLPQPTAKRCHSVPTGDTSSAAFQSLSSMSPVFEEQVSGAPLLDLSPTSSPTNPEPPSFPGQLQGHALKRTSGPVTTAKPKVPPGVRSVHKSASVPVFRDMSPLNGGELPPKGAHFVNPLAIDDSFSGQGPPPYSAPAPPNMPKDRVSPTSHYQQPGTVSRASAAPQYQQPQLVRRGQEFTNSESTHVPDIPPRQQERQAQTLYDCNADNVNELSFQAGQIVQNVRPSKEPGWLQGTIGGLSGLIPENYVQML